MEGVFRNHVKISSACWVAILWATIVHPASAQTGLAGNGGGWTKGAAQGFVEYHASTDSGGITIGCDVAASLDHSGSGISVTIGAGILPPNSELVFIVDGNDMTVRSGKSGGLSVYQCPECVKRFQKLLSMMKAGQRLEVRASDGRSAEFSLQGFSEIMDEPCPMPTLAEAAPESDGDEAAAVSHANDGREMAHVQRLLNKAGYDPGPIDGVMGRRTRAAIRSFQSDRDLPVTGEPGPDLLAALEHPAPEPPRQTSRPQSPEPLMQAAAPTPPLRKATRAQKP